MYYDEKVIHGILCHRSTPDGKWIPFTSEQLTKKYEDLRYASWSFRNSVTEWFSESIPVDIESEIDKLNRIL